MVKGVGAERSYEMLTLALLTRGGSGFLQDYPVEQYIRDSKIDSLYEGTTAIQTLDLFFRKLVRDNGRRSGRCSPGRVLRPGEGGDEATGRLETERAALAEGVAGHVEAMPGAMTGFLVGSAEQPEEVYKVGLTVRSGCCWRSATWIDRLAVRRQAEVAGIALDSAGRDRRRASQTTTSTRASSPRPGSSPRPSCRGWRVERTIIEETRHRPDGRFPRAPSKRCL